MNLPPVEDPGYLLDLEMKFQHPLLVEFIAYWNNKRGAREFPSRADIVPRDHIKLLPWMHMYDVGYCDGGKLEFRSRLLGTGLADLYPPVDWRGKKVSEQEGPVYERLQLALNFAVQSRAPFRAVVAQAKLPGQDFQGVEHLIAPLSSNGVDIDIVLMVSLLDNFR